MSCPLCSVFTAAVQQREGNQGGLGENRHHCSWQEFLQGGAQFTSPVPAKQIQPNQHQDTQLCPSHTQWVSLTALHFVAHVLSISSLPKVLTALHCNISPLLQICPGYCRQWSLCFPHGRVYLLPALSSHQPILGVLPSDSFRGRGDGLSACERNMRPPQ